MSQQVEQQQHPRVRYLYMAIGGSICLVLILPALLKANIKAYHKFKTPSQKVLLASVCFSGLYLMSLATICYTNFVFYDNQFMASIYMYLVLILGILIIIPQVLLTSVILERLCVVQPTGERTLRILRLHYLHISFRTLSCVIAPILVVVYAMDDSKARKMYVDIIVAANALLSIIVHFSVNYVVAKRIYTGSVEFVKDYYDQDNVRAKSLARRLFLIMALSTVFEITATLLYAFETRMELPILALFYPSVIGLHLWLETFYQKEVRKIYVSRGDFRSNL